MKDFSKQKNINYQDSIEERIGFLKHCASLYENEGTSPINDFTYDEEYYKLEQLDPDNEFFSEVGGEIDEHIYGTLVKHDIVMGSLSKCPDLDSFLEWTKNTFKGKVPSLIFQHKIDGLSLSLLYRDGKLVRALTRGDGQQGVDVTLNAQHVEGVPSVIVCKEEVEVRGECYKKRDDFYAKWHKSVGGKYANPRNFSSGSLNQKDAKVTKERGLSFIAYEVVRKPFATEIEKNKWIKEMGFDNLWEKGVSSFVKEGLTPEQATEAVKAYMDKIDRSKLQYDIDGVVVKLNDISIAKSMGSTGGGKKPKSARAVKFPPEEKETILESVSSNVGRTGAIIPVAHLKPVELGGAMISKVTLHNWGALVGKDAIKIGARVVIAKKGDIIPQIISVKKNGTDLTEPPTHCPGCGEELEWDANRVNIVCVNPLCVSQLNGRIEHWFKKIGTKGIGPGIIKRLTDSNELEWEGKPIIQSLPEMYYMLDNDRRSEHPFRKYTYLKENLGEKNFQNIVDSIHSVKEITLSKFIQALGIANVGTLSSLIIEIAPTIEDIDKLTTEDLMKLEKFGEKKSKSFVEGWKKSRGEIKILLKYVKIIEKKVESNKLGGKTFCVTGTLSKKREDVKKEIEENGGVVKSSVGKSLDYLVAGENAGSKEAKAKSFGVSIISEEELEKMLN